MWKKLNSLNNTVKHNMVFDSETIGQSVNIYQDLDIITNLHNNLCGRTAIVATCELASASPLAKLWLHFFTAEYFAYINYPKYSIVVPSDGKCGSLVNNSWVGVIGMVSKGEADFGLDMSITSKRSHVVDFSNPLVLSSLAIVTMEPVPQNNSDYFFEVYPPLVFALILISLLMISALSLVFEMVLKPREWNGFNLIASILWKANRLLCAASLKSNFHCSGLLLTTWFLALLIFSSCYNNFLYAKFAVPTKSKPIDSGHDLENIVKSTSLKWGTLGDSAFEAMFKSALQGIMTKLWFLAKPNWKTWNVNTTKEGYARVVGGKYAFVDLRMNAVMSNENYLGIFHISSNSLNILLESVALNKNSPFKSSCNIFIRRITEAGIVEKWETDVILSTSGKTRISRKKHESSTEKALQMNILVYVFCMMAVGHTLSGLLFVAEIMAEIMAARIAKKKELRRWKSVNRKKILIENIHEQSRAS